MGTPENIEQTFLRALLDKVFQEGLLVVILFALVVAMGWFCYSMVSTVIELTKQTTIVIHENTDYIRSSQRETIERMANDNLKIVHLLEDIKREIKEGK